MDRVIRCLLFQCTEYLLSWSALLMMNETEDGKLPDLRKLAGVMFINYISSIIANVIPRLIEIPLLEMFHVPILLIPMLLCCTIFTGGVVKIVLSLLLVDIWMGVGEILTSFIYYSICGQKPMFFTLFFYEGNLLIQWLITCGVILVMLFVTRPLFYKYKSISVLEEKVSASIVLFYLIISAAWPVNGLEMQEANDLSWYWRILFYTLFLNVMLILWGCNRKRIMDLKMQSLYLKQKMEREYALVFSDMDRDMRRFRHDVKKHMDALAYLEKQEEHEVPAALLEKYQQDLKEIYTELTYGNYCNKYDINLVMMQLEGVCRRHNVEFVVALKNLGLDSLPVHIRVQLFENLNEWAEKTMEAMELGKNGFMKGKLLLSFHGVSSAGFHTLKVSLEQKISSEGMKEKQTYIWRCVCSRSIIGKIKKILHGYNPSVKGEYSKSGKRLTISWHEKRTYRGKEDNICCR